MDRKHLDLPRAVHEKVSRFLCEPGLWKVDQKAPDGCTLCMWARTLLGLYLGTQSPSEAWKCPSLQRALNPAPVPSPDLVPQWPQCQRPEGSAEEKEVPLQARLRIGARRVHWGQQAPAPKQGAPHTPRGEPDPGLHLPPLYVLIWKVRQFRRG